MQEFSEVEWEWVYALIDASGLKRGLTTQPDLSLEVAVAELLAMHPGARDIRRRKRLTSAWLSDEEVVHE